MVDLMLEDARAPAAGFDANRTVVESHPLDRHHFGARHLASPTGDAQAAFVTENSTVRLDDLGVDQRNRELRAAFVVEVLRYVDPDQAAQYPNLRCRQPHARGGQHRLIHILGEAAQAVVHISDPQRLLPESRVTFEQYFEKRHELTELQISRMTAFATWREYPLARGVSSTFGRGSPEASDRRRDAPVANRQRRRRRTAARTFRHFRRQAGYPTHRSRRRP